MLHKKQFAILQSVWDDADYRHHLLEGGWVLNYHCDLPVTFSADKRVILLGHAWQVTPGQKLPAEQIKDLPADAPIAEVEARLLSEEESWCGRYVLVIGSRVYLDAVGSLGVFYSSAGVSSDLLLLAQSAGNDEKLYHCLEKLTWCPGPMTAYDSVFRLLPSQAYDYASGSLSPRSLTATSYRHIKNDADLLRTFTELFCNSLQNMAALFSDRQLLVAVTGGYDSRTVLALAKRSGISFEGFTLEHEQMSIGDLETPRKLCQAINVPHTYIARDPSLFLPEREQEHIHHVGGTYHAKDRRYYCFGQYDELSRRFGKVVILRGNIWEVAQNSYRRFFSENVTADEIIRYFYLSSQPRESQAIRDYIDWCHAHPQPDLSLRTRFDWEQNMAGCWMTEGEHGFDLYDRIISLQPLNCRLLITMLFDFPEEERFVRYHQTRIAEYACPSMQGIPYGSEKISGSTPLNNLIGKIRRESKRIRKNGLRNALRTYINTIQTKLDSKRNHF